MKRTATSEWDVLSNFHSYVRDDLEWKCSCLFNSSARLPCHHLLLIARDGHHFQELPVTAIHRQWSVREAADMYDDIEQRIQNILPVLDIVQLKPK